ncbi:intermembrane phospholipid transport protein YdbH family protein [Oceanisphaera avium]|uniref:Uncharacterized protein n=1 Tax=Oceanisphaera avium TaxID=1903694 RepID=A0A1Y0D0M0_9GAMM|nr:YdbH domain-containing protein [Oceanisphaera avium]ART80565.1 hypothetical protein CBP12_10790 [Oceanisphaera avium]
MLNAWLCALLFFLSWLPAPASAGLLDNYLSESLTISASAKQITTPACAKERAVELSVALIEGQLQGHLAELSVDLTCTKPRLKPYLESEGTSGASILYALPALEFTIDHLILHLPEGRFSGPARLSQQQQTFKFTWQSNAGPSQLTLEPSASGWRWQGALPGVLVSTHLTKPLSIKGTWQPTQPLTTTVQGSLPAPLVGNWQLALAGEHTLEGWQLLPKTQLSVERLRWKNLSVNQLTLTPQHKLALNKPWQLNLNWQEAYLGNQVLPITRVQLSSASMSAKQGAIRANLNPRLQLTGQWNFNKGLSLKVPKQEVAAIAAWEWLAQWQALPVGLALQAGQLEFAASASNLLDAATPILVSSELRQGQFKYRDMLAESVSAKVKLNWSQALGWQSRGPQALAVEKLNIGVPITDIHGAWRWQPDGMWLLGLTAKVFDGHVALSPMLINTYPQGEAHFSDISLEKLLSYASVEGLSGSGTLKGRLPFKYDQGMSVNNGRASSQDGWISYQASEQLKENGETNISLGLTLGLLSDLRYHHLTADISMANTGEAIINSHLEGQAPVKGKLHPVNLNYHHQENLLQLLASLRFAENLTERLPANLQGESE